MFDIETSATIKAITVRAKTIEGVTTRRCRIQLTREFDESIAACIGPQALRAIPGLTAGEIEKLVFAIDGVLANLKLTAHEAAEECTIARAVGVRAVASAPREEDAAPSVRLEFEFPFSRDVWIFMGENAGAGATIEIKPAQETLHFQKKAS